MPLLNIVIVLVVLFLFFLAFLLLRTASSMQAPPPIEHAPELDLPPGLAAEHLSSALRCETVSNLEGAAPNRAAFLQLHRVLERWYPRVHEHLVREYINEYSLLYIWPGRNPELPGVLLAAHQDVVPVDPSSLEQWEHEPFSGDVADGYVWGRGALDLKCQLTAILDAVEYLLNEGYSPERSIYLAFGHDEELGGGQGSVEIAACLKRRGVELSALLDEGGMVLSGGMLPGVDGPVALVGVAEKGVLTLKLTVEAEPWHSSMPLPQTAIGILSGAVQRLEANPPPMRLDAVRRIYQHLGAAASLGSQFVFSNLWLLGGPVRRRLAANPATNAEARTTVAATLVRGGIKENILPRRAEAVVSYRLLPGDTIAAVCAHVKKVIGDKRVQIEAIPAGAWEASPVTDTDTPEYESLRDTIRRVFGGLAVAPYLTVGATDARHFRELSPNLFRFSPYPLGQDEIRRLHGINERISEAHLERMVQFYVELIRAWS